MPETPTNAREATIAALAEIEDRIAAIRESLDLPEAVYNKAPGVPAEEQISALADIRAWTEWAERAHIDESAANRSLTRIQLAKASGYGIATINRWKASPVPLSNDRGEWGPKVMRKRWSKSLDTPSLSVGDTDTD